MAKNYELSIRKALEDSGIYKKRLDQQIGLTAMQLRLLDRIVEKLESSELVNAEISASGTEKQVADPLLPYAIKLFGQVSQNYESLGLNYNVKPQNVKEDLEPAKDTGPFFGQIDDDDD